MATVMAMPLMHEIQQPCYRRTTMLPLSPSSIGCSSVPLPIDTITGSTSGRYVSAAFTPSSVQQGTFLPRPVDMQKVMLEQALINSQSSLMIGWAEVLSGLSQLASTSSVPEYPEQAVSRGLQRMVNELSKWKLAHPMPEESALLLYRLPRATIGKQLWDLIKVGVHPYRDSVSKMRFVEAAAHITSQLQFMSITPQEEKLFAFVRNMEVEEPQQGCLGENESFGKQLHLKGGTLGKIQLMQDWEWPYMYALADLGFELSLDSLPKAAAATPGSKRILRILEVGWGQGISGRRLMDATTRTGAANQGVKVQYEVIELHPVVAADARREAAKRPSGSMIIHEGPWQLVLPRLARGAYDLVFYDPLNVGPEYMGEKPLTEKWGIPTPVFENLQFYRLLRPGGVVVQYAISHRAKTIDILQYQIAPLFRELKLTRIKGLKPESYTSYATLQEADSLEVPALIK